VGTTVRPLHVISRPSDATILSSSLLTYALQKGVFEVAFGAFKMSYEQPLNQRFFQTFNKFYNVLYFSL
jgi:hypothetical protein